MRLPQTPSHGVFKLHPIPAPDPVFTSGGEIEEFDLRHAMFLLARRSEEELRMLEKALVKFPMVRLGQKLVPFAPIAPRRVGRAVSH
jgi:hypothetical protein